jgi:hypothetical protein
MMTLRGSFAAAAVALLVAVPAMATIVKSLSLEDMVKEADVIVQGTVVQRTMSWNDERTRIYTVTDVRVADVLKGPVHAGETIHVRQLGGTVDGISQSIPGNAKLSPNEEVVLFLDRDEQKPLHYIVGMAQGKFTVDRTAAQPSVVRQLDGLALAEVENGHVKGLQGVPATPAPSPALDAFKAQIRAAIHATH